MSLIKAVILDIEGTTTPITFVADVMFPYIRKELESYLDSQWGTTELFEDIDLLRQLAEKDIAEGNNVESIPSNDVGKDVVLASVRRNILQQMDIDRKTTALKQLQGHIWKNGFETGNIVGMVYDDVIAAFDQWKAFNTSVYIYSSGSIFAQKLLFGHTSKGNLLPYLSNHFDTTIGSKLEASSYTKIFESISQEGSLKIDEILFVTDNVREYEAATEAGMKSMVAIRPGNAPLPEGKSYDSLESFDVLFEKFKFD